MTSQPDLDPLEHASVVREAHGGAVGAQARVATGRDLCGCLDGVVAAAVAVFSMQRGADPVRAHLLGGQPGHGVDVRLAIAAAAGDSRLERQVGIAHQKLADAAAVPGGVDEAGK